MHHLEVFVQRSRVIPCDLCTVTAQARTSSSCSRTWPVELRLHRLRASEVHGIRKEADEQRCDRHCSTLARTGSVESSMQMLITRSVYSPSATTGALRSIAASCSVEMLLMITWSGSGPSMAVTMGETPLRSGRALSVLLGASFAVLSIRFMSNGGPWSTCTFASMSCLPMPTTPRKRRRTASRTERGAAKRYASCGRSSMR